MAKFFFHFFDGANEDRDETGIELENAEQAYLEAHSAAQAMWGELMAERVNPAACAFRVTTDKDGELFRLYFSELLDLCHTPTAQAVRPPEALTLALRETHERAMRLRLELRETFDAVYDSLREANGLLARISELERAPRR